MASVYFDPAVGGDGTIVSDDSNPSTGLANGGHRTRFVPALAQMVAVAENTVNEALSAAASSALASDWAVKMSGPVTGGEYSAKYWAQTAINAPGTAATSTTSLTVGLGSKSLTLAQTGKTFVVGQYVEIVNSTTAWMVGLITAFNSGTGAMTVNVTNTGGSGTQASWTITPTNPPELPSQSGNAGKFLSTDGGNASWQPSGLVTRSARTSNTALALADKGSLIDITSGTFTQTFNACSTLGDGWWCYIRNSGSGEATLDPSGSETIDGLTSFIMYPGEVRLVQCDGSALRSAVISPFAKTFTTSGTFIKPPGYTVYSIECYGAGGGGGGGYAERSQSDAAANKAGGGTGGGGGGSIISVVEASSISSSVSVTVGLGGSGGAGGSIATPADLNTSAAGSSGGAGGASSFGSLLSASGGDGGIGGTGAASTTGAAGGGFFPGAPAARPTASVIGGGASATVIYDVVATASSGSGFSGGAGGSGGAASNTSAANCKGGDGGARASILGGGASGGAGYFDTSTNSTTLNLSGVSTNGTTSTTAGAGGGGGGTTRMANTLATALSAVGGAGGAGGAAAGGGGGGGALVGNGFGKAQMTAVAGDGGSGGNGYVVVRGV